MLHDIITKLHCFSWLCLFDWYSMWGGSTSPAAGRTIGEVQTKAQSLKLSTDGHVKL
jgi:hypothetical protein